MCIAVVQFKKGDESLIPKQFPNISCEADENIVHKDIILSGYPLDILQNGYEVPSKYWMYSANGPVKAIQSSKNGLYSEIQH